MIKTLYKAIIEKVRENKAYAGIIAIAVVVALLATMFPLHIERGNPSNAILNIGTGRYRIVIGNQVNAQAANYTCDGVDDDVEFQTALDALPAIGGELLILAGTYVWNDAVTVTRAIDNVTVVGVGAAVLLTGDAVTPLFTAGGDRWVFSNLRTDDGGLTMTGTDYWMWLNIFIGATFYSVEAPDDPLGGVIATLDDIGDVNVPGPSDQYLIYWDNVASKWQAQAISNYGLADLGTKELNDLDDVDTTESVGWYIYWDDGDSKWESKALAIADIPGLQVILSGISDNVTSLQGDISSIQGDLNTLESRVNSINSTVIGYGIDISNLQGDVSDFQDDLDALEGRVDSINGTLIGYGIDISTLQGDVSDLQNDVSDLQSLVLAVAGNVTTLQGDVSDLQGDVSDLQGDVSDLQADVIDLQSRMAAAEAALVGIGNNVTSLQGSSHTQGTDTTLGTQGENLDMGGYAITSVGNVDGVDVSDHDARHKWLGADAINIKDLFMVLNPFYSKGWQDITGFTASHTNTGSFTVGFPLGLLSTGATTNSRGCVYETNGLPIYTSTPLYNIRYSLSINQATAPISYTAWFGLLDSPTAPTATQKHIAFKIVAGNIWASCGDGTNGNLEDTGIDIGQFTTEDLYIVQVLGNLYYYINGVLKVTFTTYCPTNWETAKATMYVLNSAGEATSFKVYPLKMYLGAN